MTVGTFKEYFNNYSDDKQVYMMIFNQKEKKAWSPSHMYLNKRMSPPILVVEVEDGKNIGKTEIDILEKMMTY